MRLGVTWAAVALLVAALSLLGARDAGAADGPAVFDLVIRGGRVIDPESGLDAVRDIGIRDGRIALIAQRKLAGLWHATRRSQDAEGLHGHQEFVCRSREGW